jgi:methylated-DNA-protein-cysteine methyltransferase-like protein
MRPSEIPGIADDVDATAAAPVVAPVYARIIDMVRQIPRGQVATYGQIALIVGGCTPRMVGFCMASLDRDTDVPWQRVINHQGKISPRGVGLGAQLQRELLLQEGVEFSDAGRISFRRFGWLDPY